MKILSKQKDYYDHIAGMYGGGDPKIIYKRDQIKNAGKFDHTDIPFTEHVYFPNLPFQKRDWYNMAWLVVNGHYYLVLKCSYNHPNYRYEKYKEYKWHIIDDRVHEDVYSDIIKAKVRKNIFGNNDNTRNHYVGRYSQHLDVLSRVIESPVFMIDNTQYYKGLHAKVFSNVPLLKDIGIASLISAEQMYQQIQHYLTNVIRESSDTKPPVNVSDKDLLVAKGFDKRISFRHR